MRNRFPHPPKGFMAPGWNPGHNDFYQNYGNLPNGMPFDGGTYQNGYVRTSVPQVENQAISTRHVDLKKD